MAAIVFIADGDIDRLRRAVELSRVDWRDVLVAGGLAGATWPATLDALLGLSSHNCRSVATTTAQVLVSWPPWGP